MNSASDLKSRGKLIKIQRQFGFDGSSYKIHYICTSSVLHGDRIKFKFSFGKWPIRPSCIIFEVDAAAEIFPSIALLPRARFPDFSAATFIFATLRLRTTLSSPPSEGGNTEGNWPSGLAPRRISRAENVRLFPSFGLRKPGATFPRVTFASPARKGFRGGGGPRAPFPEILLGKILSGAQSSKIHLKK